MGSSDLLRGLLEALTPKVATCRGREFSAEEIAHALYGLNSQEDSPELRGLIAALTPKVRGYSL